MTHSNISPSSAERFFNCPACVKEQAKVKFKEPSNQYALEGTALHELAAKCLTLDKNPKEFMGTTIEVKNNFDEIIEFEVTEEFVNAITLYQNVIYDILDSKGASKKALRIESKVTLPEIDKKAKGTVDCSFIAGDTLYVIDFKGGAGITVNPEENKQCMYYALRPYLDAKMLIQKIVIGIIQPRTTQGDTIKIWECSPQRLDEFAKELKTAIAKTRVKQPKYQTGPWCKYCKALTVCKPMQNTIMEPVKEMIPDITDFFPKLTDITADQIGKALPVLEILKGYMEALYKHAFSLATMGETIPNYCMVKGKKQRRYTDEIAVQEAFASLGDKIFTTPKLKSPAQLEKLVGKNQLADYVYVPEGDLKLIPTKDTKDQIKMSLDDIFSELPEEKLTN